MKKTRIIACSIILVAVLSFSAFAASTAGSIIDGILDGLLSNSSDKGAENEGNGLNVFDMMSLEDLLNIYSDEELAEKTGMDPQALREALADLKNTEFSMSVSEFFKQLKAKESEDKNENDTNNNTEETVLLTMGDVNGDGKVTAADARMVLRAAAKLIKLNESQLVVADVNFDNKVTAADARKILRVAAKLDTIEWGKGVQLLWEILCI